MKHHIHLRGEAMTHRERVLTTFARQKPDRIPRNYLANPGIDGRLKAHFGLKKDDNEGLRQALDIDFRSVAAPYIGLKRHEDVPDRQVDMWGIHRRWVAHETGGYWDFCDFPLQHATLEEIEAWPLPSPDDFDYASVAEQCRCWQGYCVTTGNPGVGDIINSTSMIRTMEQVLVDLMLDDPACLCYVDRKTAIQLEMMNRTLEAAQGSIDVLWLGEDLGTQRGPLIGLELFRRHIRPRHQQFVDLAKHYGIPVMMHSCGSSSWAYDDFIDMGISVVDTLQPEPRDMAPAFLKARYGDRLAFHGCISTAGPVAAGTVRETVENVRETLDTMMEGGGYAFSPTHQLQDNSPTENVVAMYEAADTYGQYGP
ncbi:MAG: uroporphyrinogen decarboxylase family protein [Candidatus Latescibacteria bacterium]|nr:uroporphyrinogen decarboxylase family protein [Candidatus Latescibacterota bacterium]